MPIVCPQKVNICQSFYALFSDSLHCEPPRCHFCHLPIRFMSYLSLPQNTHWIECRDNAEIYVYDMFAITFHVNHFTIESCCPQFQGHSYKLSTEFDVKQQIAFCLCRVEFLLVRISDWVCFGDLNYAHTKKAYRICHFQFVFLLNCVSFKSA